MPIGQEQKTELIIPDVVLKDIKEVINENNIQDSVQIFAIKLMQQALIDYFDAYYDDFEGLT